jgi:hypothetical protein
MSNLSNNAAALLTAQIDELSKIRNASPRDPQFKQWRQNTLTVIQRVWQGDTSRSERFRRIPFSPPSTQSNARDAREFFERGCGEALEYLNSLRRQLEGDEGGGPPPIESAPDTLPGNFEDDYPTVQLPGDAPQAPGRDAPHAGPPRVPGRPGESPARPLPQREATSPPPAASNRIVPPAQRVSVRGEGGNSEEQPKGPEKVNPLRDILSSMKPSAPPPSAERPKRGRKASRQRLKEMLGFEQEGGGKPAQRPAPPIESRPQAPPERHAPPDPPPTAPRAQAPSTDRPSHFELAEFLVPGEPMLSLNPGDVDEIGSAPAAPEAAEPIAVPGPPRIEPARPAAAIPSPVEFLLPEEPSAPEDLELEPPAGASDPAADETSRMTAEFLMSSPVLSSLARPAPKRGTASGSAGTSSSISGGPVSSQLMQLASDVESLGVSEGQRALTRATLVDLARLLETGDISWDTLRDAIQFLMQFPPLARRALPLLMPYLDIAA